jgi:hypothetical protein
MPDNDIRQSGHPAMDYEEHEKTYRLFLKLIKFTIAGVAFILALLAFLSG